VTEPTQLDLLLDLVKLLKKYGPETFKTLATALRDPDQLAHLSETLNILSNESGRLKLGPRDRPESKSSLRSQIEFLAEKSPEKAALLRKLLDQLMAPEGISIADLRAYARQTGLPQLKSGDRSRLVQAFVASLMTLDLPQIQDHIERLAMTPRTNDRDLAGWSRIILDPEFRSAQGS
jgi:hypothetical protein